MEHTSAICVQMLIVFGVLKRNLSACSERVKESAYKGLVCPVLEYGSSEELEKVQKRAARFVTDNYIYETGSMTGILEQLKVGISEKKKEK